MKHDFLKAMKALGILTLVYQLAACSVTAGNGEAPPAPNPDKFGGKPRVAGPAVEGTWKSDCVKDYYESRRWTMSFSGDAFSRSQETFSDTECKISKTPKTFAGTFIFSVAFADGSYEVNYAVDLGNGWTQFMDEKLMVANDSLYVSNFYSGESAPLVYTMPMKKQAAFAGEMQ